MAQALPWSTLFAALNAATGRVTGMYANRRRLQEFLEFMNEVGSLQPGAELHVALDNLSTHKPKHDLWLAPHRRLSALSAQRKD